MLVSTTAVACPFTYSVSHFPFDSYYLNQLKIFGFVSLQWLYISQWQTAIVAAIHSTHRSMEITVALIINVVHFICVSYVVMSGFLVRVVFSQRWREANSIRTPNINRCNPDVEISALINSIFRPLLQLRRCRWNGTRRKLQWMFRKGATLLDSTRVSLCGSPFPLYCLSLIGTLPLRPGIRAARLRSSFCRPVPANMVRTQVSMTVVCRLKLLHLRFWVVRLSHSHELIVWGKGMGKCSTTVCLVSWMNW